jgi:hypothetical protein
MFAQKRMYSRIQNRLIAPYPELPLGTKVENLYVPPLFRRLLLFDTYILQTIRFNEFIPLARALGTSNVIKLLDSDALKLELDPNQIVQVGQSGSPLRSKPALPRGSVAFSVLVVQGGNYYTYLHRCIQDVRRNLYGYLSEGDLLKLESAIFRALLPRLEPPCAFPKSEALEDLIKELRAQSQVIKRSLMLRVSKVRGLDIPESELQLRIIPIDETDFRLESNLARFGLDDEEAHKMLEGACLAVGALSSRIEEMKTNEALSGCIDDELALFGQKFDLLTNALAPSTVAAMPKVRPQAHEEDFGRVLRVCKLPTFDLHPPDRSFDMEHFLEVRSCKEAVEFRAWLRSIHAASDEEIADQIQTFRARLGTFAETKVGRFLRFALFTGAGMLADANVPCSGTAFGALDSFLVDKILRVSGPTLYLSRRYRSLFEKSDT